MPLPTLEARRFDSDLVAVKRLVPVDPQSGQALGPPRVLRGFNVSGAAKRRGYPCGSDAASLPAIAGQVFALLAADGFNLVRLPVIWEYLEPQLGLPDPELASALRAYVELARSHGLYVIVDLHQDLVSSLIRNGNNPEHHGVGLPPELVLEVNGPGRFPAWIDRPWQANYKLNPNVVEVLRALREGRFREEYGAFAARVGALLAGCDNVLAYEPFNEPYSEYLFDKDDREHGYSDLCQAVREGLAQGGARLGGAGRTPTVAVMPAGNWLVPELPVAFELNPAKVWARTGFAASGPQGGAEPFWLTTPHLYDPTIHAAQVLPPSASALPRVADLLGQVLGEGGYGLTPLVGEFGVPSTVIGGPAERDRLHRAWLDAFEVRGLGWCHWNFNPEAVDESGDDRWCGERFSVAYRQGERVRTSPAYAALLRPFVTSMAGPIQQCRFEPGADGAWSWALAQGPAFQGGWQTEVWVPASLGAFRVDPQAGAQVEGRRVLLPADCAQVRIQADPTPSQETS